MTQEDWKIALLEILRAQREEIFTLQKLTIAMAGTLKELVPGSDRVLEEWRSRVDKTPNTQKEGSEQLIATFEQAIAVLRGGSDREH